MKFKLHFPMAYSRYVPSRCERLINNPFVFFFSILQVSQTGATGRFKLHLQRVITPSLSPMEQMNNAFIFFIYIKICRAVELLDFLEKMEIIGGGKLVFLQKKRLFGF